MSKVEEAGIQVHPPACELSMEPPPDSMEPPPDYQAAVTQFTTSASAWQKSVDAGPPLPASSHVVKVAPLFNINIYYFKILHKFDCTVRSYSSLSF